MIKRRSIPWQIFSLDRAEGAGYSQVGRACFGAPANSIAFSQGCPRCLKQARKGPGVECEAGQSPALSRNCSPSARAESQVDSPCEMREPSRNEAVASCTLMWQAPAPLGRGLVASGGSRNRRAPRGGCRTMRW